MSFNLQKFIENMTKILYFSNKSVFEYKEKVQVLNSDPLSKIEKNGVTFKIVGPKPGFEFQFWMHYGHKLIDFLPPIHPFAKKTIKSTKNTWLPAIGFKNINIVITTILQKIYIKEIEKFLPQPSNRTSLHANFTRKKTSTAFSSVMCNFNGKQHPLNKCPMCRCVCQHETPLVFT